MAAWRRAWQAGLARLQALGAALALAFALAVTLALSFNLPAMAQTAPPAAPAPAAASASASASRCEGIVPVGRVTRRVRFAGDERPAQPAAEVAVPDALSLALRQERARISYDVDVSACADHPAAALWMFRVGAPYRVSVGGVPLTLMRANTLASATAVADLSEPLASVYNGRIPAIFALPAGTRQVHIELLPLPYLPYGLVGLEIGPTNRVLPEHTAAVRNVIGYGDAGAGVVLVTGLLSFLLWLPRRRDLNLLWLALASATWGARGLLYFDNAIVGTPLWFEQLNPIMALLSSAALAAASIYLVRPPGERRRAQWLMLAMVGAILLAFVVTAAIGRGALLARSAAQLGGTALVCWLGLEFWWQRQRLPVRHTAALLACVAALLVSVGHDLMVVAGALSPRSNPYVFWGYIVVLVGFALISGEYVVATLKRAERSNEDLERRVAHKSSELEQSYQRLRHSERERARTQERERLLREMHDGLGAHLMTALRGVERGALNPAQVAKSLQDSLDELRLLMDSAETHDFLPGALAAWRNRWDHRLAAAGVHLNWRVDDALDDVALEGEAAMHILRILQEAATNIVKHAQAREMHLEAGVDVDAATRARALRIVIRDDGLGFPPGQAPAGGRGLGHMRQRAEQIGAVLSIGPNPGGRGTAVALRLPLAAP